MVTKTEILQKLNKLFETATEKPTAEQLGEVADAILATAPETTTIDMLEIGAVEVEIIIKQLEE